MSTRSARVSQSSYINTSLENTSCCSARYGPAGFVSKQEIVDDWSTHHAIAEGALLNQPGAAAHISDEARACCTNEFRKSYLTMHVVDSHCVFVAQFAEFVSLIM